MISLPYEILNLISIGISPYVQNDIVDIAGISVIKNLVYFIAVRNMGKKARRTGHGCIWGYCRKNFFHLDIRVFIVFVCFLIRGVRRKNVDDIQTNARYNRKRKNVLPQFGVQFRKIDNGSISEKGYDSEMILKSDVVLIGIIRQEIHENWGNQNQP